MSENFNNKTTLAQKLKGIKVNRSAVISACLLLVAIIIVTSVAVASNRARKDKTNLPDTTITDTDSVTDTTADTKPADTEAAPTVDPTDTEGITVEDKLPSFILPVSGSVYKEHDPALQVFSNTMNDYRVHLGVDIATEEASPVYAAADGKISKIWEDTLMGYCIAIKHSGSCYTIYKNLSKTLPDGIAEGVSVRSGQLIASVGESAMVEVADEPHLHFEMTVADLAVDPLEYFDEKALGSLGLDASHGE